MKASEFAKMRGIDPRTVNKYLERHPELREDCRKEGNSLVLGEYAERELSKIYPLPSPVIIGIPEEEHRKVLEDLLKAQNALIMLQNELADQKLLNAQNEANMMLLEDKKEYLEKRMQEQEQEQKREKEEQEQENRKLKEEIERLRNRNLLDRIFNK